MFLLLDRPKTVCSPVPPGPVALWGSALLICGWPSLFNPSQRRKRADTRSQTAAVCPFKSIEAILIALEAPGQIGGGALVTHHHGHQRTGIGGPGDGRAVALIKNQAHRHQGDGGRRQPAKAE